MKIGKARMEDGGNGFFIIASTSLADTDQSLQQHCQSVNTMQKKPWNLVMNAPKIRPTLSELIVAITSQNDWECLTGKKKIEHARLPLSIHTLEDGCQIENIRCGLIAMRHQIVHQPNAPDLATIRPLAYFGESFLKRVLCPINGIASKGIRDPLKRCSRFKRSLSC